VTTKEWLMRAWRIDKEITALIIARDETRNRCLSVTVPPDGDRVQCSADHDANLVQLASLEQEIDKRVDELCAIKLEILTAVSEVSDSTLRTLLIERYISFKTWEQIAVDMSYSYVHIVHNLHPMALKLVEATVNSI